MLNPDLPSARLHAPLVPSELPSTSTHGKHLNLLSTKSRNTGSSQSRLKHFASLASAGAFIPKGLTSAARTTDEKSSLSPRKGLINYGFSRKVDNESDEDDRIVHNYDGGKNANVMMIKEYMNRSLDDVREISNSALPMIPTVKVGKPNEESGYEA